MTEVNPARNHDALIRASRLSAVLTAASAICVLIGLVFSAHSLVDARMQLADAEQHLKSARENLNTVNANLKDSAAKLEQLRCALANSRSAIEAFHQRDYGGAISMYNQALRCDPDNAYLLNLNAYSHFKNRDVAGAIELELRSIKANPNYGWGYFDLARFYCARDGGRSDNARAAIDKAVQLDERMTSLMATDGEFSRLCGKG
jgi:tetratricopeptide (TPR) repeat protein